MGKQPEERRVYAECEVRKVDGDERSPGKLEGYAAVFNRMSQPMGRFREIIRPGAFREAIEQRQIVRARVQHQGGLHTIGSTESGTLRIQEDSIGLRYEVDLPDTTAGRDIAALVARGDINKSSFAFRVKPATEMQPTGERWYKDEGGQTVRELTRLDLVDVAPVDDPAYMDTSVAQRSLEYIENTHAELREYRAKRIELAEKSLRQTVDDA